MKRSIVVGISLAALALVLAMAGGPRASEARGARVEVEMASFAYNPNPVSIVAGTVQFHLKNLDRGRHDLVIEINGEGLRSGPIEGRSEGTWEVTLDAPGEYPIWCSVGNHRARGMTGTLFVQ